jgi:hypothetical protein
MKINKFVQWSVAANQSLGGSQGERVAASITEDRNGSVRAQTWILTYVAHADASRAHSQEFDGSVLDLSLCGHNVLAAKKGARKSMAGRKRRSMFRTFSTLSMRSNLKAAVVRQCTPGRRTSGSALFCAIREHGRELRFRAGIAANLYLRAGATPTQQREHRAIGCAYHSETEGTLRHAHDSDGPLHDQIVSNRHLSASNKPRTITA